VNKRWRKEVSEKELPDFYITKAGYVYAVINDKEKKNGKNNYVYKKREKRL